MVASAMVDGRSELHHQQLEGDYSAPAQTLGKADEATERDRTTVVTIYEYSTLGSECDICLSVTSDQSKRLNQSNGCSNDLVNMGMNRTCKNNVETRD